MSRCPRPMVEGGKTEVAPVGAGVMPRQRNRAAERLVGLREVAPALQMDDGTVLVHMEAEIVVALRRPIALAQRHHPHSLLWSSSAGRPPLRNLMRQIELRCAGQTQNEVLADESRRRPATGGTSIGHQLLGEGQGAENS